MPYARRPALASEGHTVASFASCYPEFQQRLVELSGPVGNEPSRPAFERLIAAVIASQVGKPTLEAWLSILRSLEADRPETLADIDTAELEESLRSPTKATRGLALTLKRFAMAVRAEGGIDAVLAAPDEQLREAWLAVPGLGPASVDRLLTALGRPVYPVDRATYRILVRHGWLDESAGYEEARETVISAAPNDPAALAVLGGAFERIGARWCKAARPWCASCPLAPWLPQGGPYGDAPGE